MIRQKKIFIIIALFALLLIVMRMEKKNFRQVYLEECKYKINQKKKKKIEMSRFINTELDSESDSKSGAELMTKLKSDSDTDC